MVLLEILLVAHLSKANVNVPICMVHLFSLNLSNLKYIFEAENCSK